MTILIRTPKYLPLRAPLLNLLEKQIGLSNPTTVEIAICIESSLYCTDSSFPAPAEFQLTKADDHWQIKVIAGYDYTIKSADNFGVLLMLDVSAGLLHRHGFPATPITDVKALSMFKTWLQSVTENIINNRYDDINSTILKKEN